VTLSNYCISSDNENQRSGTIPCSKKKVSSLVFTLRSNERTFWASTKYTRIQSNHCKCQFQNPSYPLSRIKGDCSTVRAHFRFAEYGIYWPPTTSSKNVLMHHVLNLRNDFGRPIHSRLYFASSVMIIKACTATTKIIGGNKGCWVSREEQEVIVGIGLKQRKAVQI
jgi:hypothetical protein